MTVLKNERSHPNYDPSDIPSKEWADSRDADYMSDIRVYVYEKAGQFKIITEWIEDMPGWRYVGPRRLTI